MQTDAESSQVGMFEAMKALKDGNIYVETGRRVGEGPNRASQPEKRWRVKVENGKAVFISGTDYYTNDVGGASERGTDYYYPLREDEDVPHRYVNARSEDRMSALLSGSNVDGSDVAELAVFLSEKLKKDGYEPLIDIKDKAAV